MDRMLPIVLQVNLQEKKKNQAEGKGNYKPCPIDIYSSSNTFK